MTIMSNNIINYVRSENGKKIIIITGDRESFRRRQRDRIGKKNPLKFVSFKTMVKDIKRNNLKNINGHSSILIGPIRFQSISKL